MNYIGKLYGKINNKYFDTGLTSIDWDNQHVDKNKEIYKAAINKWGKEIQIEIAIEEMAELIKAIQKIKRESTHSAKWFELIDNVSEEIADVEIMIEQLKLIFPIRIIMEFKTYKLERLEKRIKE